MLNLVIIIVVAGLIFWLVWWFIDWVGLPEPFNKVAKVVIGLVALIFLIKILLGIVAGKGLALVFLPMITPLLA